MRVAGDLGQRRGTAACRPPFGHQHQGGGAIVDARRVSGGHRAVLGEGGSQGRHRFRRGIAAHVLVGVDRHRALAGLDVQWCDLLDEHAPADGLRGPTMAFHRGSIGRGPCVRRRSCAPRCRRHPFRRSASDPPRDCPGHRRIRAGTRGCCHRFPAHRQGSSGRGPSRRECTAARCRARRTWTRTSPPACHRASSRRRAGIDRNRGRVVGHLVEREGGTGAGLSRHGWLARARWLSGVGQGATAGGGGRGGPVIVGAAAGGAQDDGDGGGEECLQERRSKGSGADEDGGSASVVHPVRKDRSGRDTPFRPHRACAVRTAPIRR